MSAVLRGCAGSAAFVVMCASFLTFMFCLGSCSVEDAYLIAPRSTLVSTGAFSLFLVLASIGWLFVEMSWQEKEKAIQENAKWQDYVSEELTIATCEVTPEKERYLPKRPNPADYMVRIPSPYSPPSYPSYGSSHGFPPTYTTAAETMFMQSAYDHARDRYISEMKSADANPSYSIVGYVSKVTFVEYPDYMHSVRTKSSPPKIGDKLRCRVKKNPASKAVEDLIVM